MLDASAARRARRRPDRSASHLRRANADEIICLNQFGEYLILQSSVSHGVSKLFASLLNFGEGDEIYRIAGWGLPLCHLTRGADI